MTRISTAPIEIRLGLPPEHCGAAAELYYDAFGQKLEPIMISRARGVSVLSVSLNPDFAIAALQGERLLGIAGFQHGGQRFVDPNLRTFGKEYGWLRGACRLMLLAFLARQQRQGELLMDGIVVHPSARGQGVGTQLLKALFQYAREHNFACMRLDVVDTNPRARRLYERRGFVAVRTSQYPFLRRVMGFAAVTTMIKEL